MRADRSLSDRRFRPDVERERAQAWHLAQKGLSMREIGIELGCAKSTATARVKEGRAEALAEGVLDVGDNRVRSASNLDRWQFWVEHAYEKGMSAEVREAREAVEILLKIEDRRARLLGMDAAVRFDITTQDSARASAMPESTSAVVRELAFLAECDAQIEELEREGLSFTDACDRLRPAWERRRAAVNERLLDAAGGDTDAVAAAVAARLDEHERETEEREMHDGLMDP